MIRSQSPLRSSCLRAPVLRVPPHPPPAPPGGSGGKFLRRYGLTLALFLGVCSASHGQEYASFDLFIDVNLESAEKTVGLYEGLSGRPSEVAQLKGSQIAMATTSLLLQRPLETATLQRSLEAAKFNQDLGDDIFRMKEARAQVAPLKELLAELQRRNFGMRVVKTVEQLFPPEARINTRIPMYVVAFGPQNIDAFVRRVVWKGTTPLFVNEGQGQLTIVVNLAKAVNYGQSVDERFVGLLGVVAHEVFHAAFGVYKDGAPAWRMYYATHQRPIDQLFDLTQNEGIAYYLSLIQRTRGRLTPEWERNVRTAFVTFNKLAEELLSPQLTSRRAAEIIRLSNTSGFWESYGAITGMIAARQIDQTLGRNALIETTAKGPGNFFAKYVTLMERDSNIPPLSPLLVREISRMGE